jgi:hypothetical protein
MCKQTYPEGRILIKVLWFLWTSGMTLYSLVGKCCSFLGLKNIYFFNSLLHSLDKLSKSNSACMGKNTADQLLSRVKKGKLISTAYRIMHSLTLYLFLKELAVRHVYYIGTASTCASPRVLVYWR